MSFNVSENSVAKFSSSADEASAAQTSGWFAMWMLILSLGLSSSIAFGQQANPVAKAIGNQLGAKKTSRRAVVDPRNLKVMATVNNVPISKGWCGGLGMGMVCGPFPWERSGWEG